MGYGRLRTERSSEEPAGRTLSGLCVVQLRRHSHEASGGSSSLATYAGHPLQPTAPEHLIHSVS